MKRDEILATVIRICREEVPGLRDGDLDANKSYRDLGISSMVLMGILVKTMKELKTKISGDKLAGVTTVNGLVDQLVKASG